VRAALGFVSFSRILRFTRRKRPAADRAAPPQRRHDGCPSLEAFVVGRTVATSIVVSIVPPWSRGCRRAAVVVLLSS
jgi:hypothetical protein